MLKQVAIRDLRRDVAPKMGQIVALMPKPSPPAIGKK